MSHRYFLHVSFSERETMTTTGPEDPRPSTPQPGPTQPGTGPDDGPQPKPSDAEEEASRQKALDEHREHVLSDDESDGEGQDHTDQAG